MGLREKAFLSLASGLREKANYFYGKTSDYHPPLPEGGDNDPNSNLEDQVFKKEYQLQTVLEISKEIYQSLNPSELMNMLLLTFMGQTRSSKGAFLLKEKNNWEIKLNKGIVENELEELFSSDFSEIQDLRSDNDFKAIDLVCPVLGKQQNVLGYIALEKTGVKNIQDEESVLLPLLSLGGIALENALLYDNMQTRFNQLEALAQIGDTLQQSPDLHEVLFLAFSTLEHGLGIKKLLLLLRNENDDFVVFDGYGCREETHHKMKLDINFPFFDLIMSQHQIIDCRNELKDYLSEEDQVDSNIGMILPLRVYEETNGVLIFLENSNESDLDWHKKLYELVASYFASSIYLLHNKPKNQTSTLSLKETLIKTLKEQADFTLGMNLSLHLNLIESRNENGLNRWVKDNHLQIIELILNSYIILSTEKLDETLINNAEENGIFRNVNQVKINSIDGIKSALRNLNL